MASPARTRVPGSSRSSDASRRQLSRSICGFRRGGFFAPMPSEATSRLASSCCWPGREPAGRALPQHQPLDLRLDVLREHQPRGVDLPQFPDAPRVGRGAEAGADAEAREIEPPHLVRGTASATRRQLEEHVRQPAERGDRPGVLAEAEALLERGCQAGRRCGAVAERAPHECDRFVDCLVGQHDRIPVGGRRIGLGRRRAPARLELQPPAMTRRGGFEPELEGADLGEPHRQPHVDLGLRGALAETQHRGERPVAMERAMAPPRSRCHADPAGSVELHSVNVTGRFVCTRKRRPSSSALDPSSVPRVSTVSPRTRAARSGSPPSST